VLSEGISLCLHLFSLPSSRISKLIQQICHGLDVKEATAS